VSNNFREGLGGGTFEGGNGSRPKNKASFPSVINSWGMGNSSKIRKWRHRRDAAGPSALHSAGLRQAVYEKIGAMAGRFAEVFNASTKIMNWGNWGEGPKQS